MTESEWMASADPATMLRFATDGWVTAPGGWGVPVTPPSDRKLRLFAVACCRQVWDGVPCGRHEKGSRHIHGNEQCQLTHARLGRTSDCTCTCTGKQCPDCRGTGRVGGLTDPRSRRAVEVAERHTDGLATAEEVAKARRGLGGPARFACMNSAADAARFMHGGHSQCPPCPTQAALLRCVFGNPWRPVEPSSLPWRIRDAAHHVHQIARTVHDERRPADLPILADALEEAGCDDAGLVAHLRSPGPHALPGCWAVDLILGKE